MLRWKIYVNELVQSRNYHSRCFETFCEKLRSENYVEFEELYRRIMFKKLPFEQCWMNTFENLLLKSYAQLVNFRRKIIIEK